MRTLTLIFCLILSAFAWAGSVPADSLTIYIAQAEQYKKELNYPGAFDLYQRLIKSSPQNIELRVACAELQILMGKEAEALRTFEEILILSPDNLAASIYLGNYYFLKAESRRVKLEEDYNKSTLPTRARNEEYKRLMNVIYITDYSTAYKHLDNALKTFPSAEAKRTMEKIALVEEFVKGK